MSDLTRFRDHCRKMAEAKHKPECPSLNDPGWVPIRGPLPKNALIWSAMGLYRLPPVKCDGSCITDRERALFAQMAGEVDDYLAPHVDLFGEMATEPTMEEA